MKYQSFIMSFMSASDRWCRSWLQLHAEKDSDTEKTSRSPV